MPAARNRSWSRRSSDCSASGVSGSAHLERSRGACGAMPRRGVCDAKAKRAGLSRTEYLRRALERERVLDAGAVTVDQLGRVASLAQDLDDPDVMAGAWS